jgi:hypothetical protein
MLVITGMGRSGTSVLAALCKGLRFDPGGAYTEGINAGLEDPAVVGVNEAILGLNSARGHAGERAIGRITSFGRPVIKDPRFILAGGAALRVWWQQRQDFRVLLAVREAGEVVRSRQAHPHWFGAIPDAEAQVLERDIGATIDLMTSLGIPFRCLRFPDFLKQPEEVFEALRFGGLSFSDRRARKVWTRLVDPSKVRHSPRWQGGVEPPQTQADTRPEGGRAIARGASIGRRAVELLRLRKVSARLFRPVSRLLRPDAATRA